MSDRNIGQPSVGGIMKPHYKETTSDLENIGSGKRREFNSMECIAKSYCTAEMSMAIHGHDMHGQKTTNSMNCQPTTGKTATGINSYPG